MANYSLVKTKKKVKKNIDDKIKKEKKMEVVGFWLSVSL